MKYSDPYLSGVALGLVLLAAFLFAGRGLGASGAFAATATGAVAAIAPRYAAANPYFGRYLARPANAFKPEASSTSGCSIFDTSSRTNA